MTAPLVAQSYPLPWCYENPRERPRTLPKGGDVQIDSRNPLLSREEVIADRTERSFSASPVKDSVCAAVPNQEEK